MHICGTDHRNDSEMTGLRWEIPTLRHLCEVSFSENIASDHLQTCFADNFISQKVERESKSTVTSELMVSNRSWLLAKEKEAKSLEKASLSLQSVHHDRREDPTAGRDESRPSTVLKLSEEGEQVQRCDSDI